MLWKDELKRQYLQAMRAAFKSGLEVWHRFVGKDCPNVLHKIHDPIRATHTKRKIEYDKEIQFSSWTGVQRLAMKDSKTSATTRLGGFL